MGRGILIGERDVFLTGEREEPPKKNEAHKFDDMKTDLCARADTCIDSVRFLGEENKSLREEVKALREENETLKDAIQ